MRKECMRIIMVLVASVLGIGLVRAQHPVRLSDCTFVPEANVALLATRSARAAAPPLALGTPTGGHHNVLLQFQGVLGAAEEERLAKAGVELSGYLGGNAYWALLPEGIDARQVLGRYGVRSVMATRPEWKVSRALMAGDVPPWSRRGVKGFAFVARYAHNATPAEVREDLKRLGAQDVVVKDAFHAALGVLPIDSVPRVAALDYLLVLMPEDPANELENHEGSRLCGSATLALPTEQGGRGLTGAGIRAGVWDGNIEVHPDFSNRVTRMEFESEGGAEHGTHVVGTMLGSGLLDRRGRGMAPALRVWAYNFGKQKNGKAEWEEMAEARQNHGITLTQHSYGIPLQKQHYNQYLYLSQYQFVDQFSYSNPTVINVYSAGNDQGNGAEPAKAAYGDARYGTSTKRAKNVLHIGAVSADGSMTDFSSWGPMDDGRMLPTVCAKGEGVYSTKPGEGYQSKDGTSMACPTASGHIALIQERYRQLNRGADLRSDLLRASLVAGATDAGNKGPDYSYGFGLLNAVKTVEILENCSYHKGEFEQAATKPINYTVKVPVGVKTLRVALAWIDPVVEKGYAYGDSPMVNDLDLSVTAKGTKHLPLVCDPQHPAKPAEQKEDRLNNTELVELTGVGALAGQEVTISVAPRIVAQGPQVYYVAYYFERDEVRIASPRSGDEFAPGEFFYLRVEGVTSAFEAEISTDGGKTYSHLGKLEAFDATKPYCSNVKAQLPKDITPTHQAKIRVITADGEVAESEGFFTVASSVNKLSVSSVACGLEGFMLQWDAAGAAPEGYVVLRADMARGEYEKLAEVAAEAREYKLQPEEIKDVACYTVACKRGSSWGRMAPAVIPHVKRPIVVKREALPWQENFSLLATPYFTISTHAANTQVFRASDDPSMPVGSHMHLASIGDAIEEFDYENPFADKHKKNLVTYEFCGLNLRDIPAEKTLQLRVRVGMRWAPVNATRGPWFRVLLDGKPLLDAAGVAVHERLAEVTDLYYPIAGGGEHTLALQFIGKYNIDRLSIYQLAVEENNERRDVGLTLVSMPRNAAGLSSAEEVTVLLQNMGGAEQERVGLQLLRDGVVTHQTVAESLRPHERREVTLPVDLSTSRALGEEFKVEVRADLPGDEQPDNNRVGGTVVNIGNVFAMPRGNIVFSPMGPIPVDPKKVYRLSEGERLLFTDDGGALGYFHSPQVSTLKVLPSREGRVVRVRFKEFSCDEQSAHLLVYNETVPDNLEIKDCFYDKELIGTPALPYSATSRAADGALTFFIEAYRPGMGWLAEIDEVPVQNALQIASARALQNGPLAEGEVPVQVELRNRFEQPLDNITLHYYLDEEHEGVLENVSLNANESKTLEFPQKATLKAGVVEEIKVWADCPDDSYGEDNVLTIPALYDAYPIPAKLHSPTFPSPGRLEYMDKAVVFKDAPKLSEARKHFARYQLSDVLTVYKGLTAEPVRLVKLKAKPGEVVRLWVDWNDDKKFGSGELAGEFYVDKGTDLSQAKFDVLRGLTDATAGDKRARIAVGNTEDLKTPDLVSGIQEGSTCDFIIRVAEGGYPLDGDLQLNRIELQASDGAPLLKGAKLSSDAKVVLHVQNNGSLPFGGKFAVKINLDGRVFEETVDIATRALDAIPAFGKSERSVTLEQSIDLSAVGKHVVKVTLEELPAVVNAKNNMTSEVVYSTVPEGKNYALAFKSHSDEFPEYIKLPKGYKKNKKQATVEFWAYLRASGFNTFVETEEFMACAFYKMKGGYADNSLGIVMREGVIHTKANTLLPERWNHIAIALDEIKQGATFTPGSCKVTAYINGESQELIVSTPDGTTKLDAPLLATRLDGMMDGFRLWNDTRTQEEIKANMYRSVPEGERADLAYEFLFSEGPGNKYARGITADGPFVFAELKEANTDRLQKPGELWYKLSEQPQLVKANFAGQTKIDASAGATQRIYFKKGTDLSAVTAKFVTAWPCTEVLYNENPITAETTFDFAGGKAIELTFVSKLFAEEYKQTLQFEGVEDASHECDLLTLTVRKDDNLGLLLDLSPASIAPSLVLPAAAAPNAPEAVRIRFTLSAGAKLLFKGRALNSGDAIDLSAPALLTVVAANGTSSRQYTLQLAVTNSLSTTLTDGEYTYGDAPRAISITSGVAYAPLAWTSTNPAVASYADGKLHIGRPGEATLSLWQKAFGIYGESNTVKAKIRVKKRPIAVTPKIEDVAYGQQLQWAFDYTPTIPESDAIELASLPRLAGYTLYKAAGSVAREGATLLPGEYSVKPKASSIETEKYIVTPLEQPRLHVGAVSGITALGFTVKDDRRTPLEGTSVEVAGRRMLTDSRGECAVAVEEGVYTFVVTKEGYQPHRATVEAKGPNLQREVTLKAAKHTLTYTVNADEGGFVYGPTQQLVADGANGEAVEAVAREGYRFVSWSDGMATPRRLDRDVHASAAVQARFAQTVSIPIYTVTYSIQGSGMFADGGAADRVYELREGDALPALTVVPANANAYFIAWSDGIAQMERPAGQKVTGDLTLVAEFATLAHLPLQENFEKGSLPAHWRVATDYPNPNCRWKVFQGTVPLIGTPIPSRAATIIASETMSDNPEYYSSILRLPRIDVRGLETDVKVEFDWMYMNGGDKFSLSYSIDGGAPVELWAKGDGTMQVEFEEASLSIPRAELEGKQTVEFLFTYTSTEFSWFAAIDNINIYASPSPALKVELISEPVGMATFSRDGEPIETISLNAGEKIPNIEVHAAAGYNFKEWLINGEKIAPSEYGKVCQSLVVTAVLSKANEVTISYGVEPPQAGVIMINGEAVTQQKVEVGETPAAAKAEAKAGFTFSHWADNGSKRAERAATVAHSDAHYTALFKPRAAKVNFKAQDKESSAPLAGVRLVLTDAQGISSIHTTEANGEVRVELPYGDYSYEAMHEGYAPVEKSLFAVSETTTDETVQLNKKTLTVPFNVFVCDAESGEPLRGADVRVGVELDKSDAAGAAHFNLVPSIYLYAVTCTGYKELQGDAVEIPYKGTELRIALLKNRASRNVEFVVSDSEDKNPLSAVALRVGGIAAITDAAGKANIALTDGTHEFVATLEGYAEYRQTLDVTPSVAPIEIMLERRKFTVTLEVRNEDGEPVSNATVTFNGEAKRTADDGAAAFEAITPGEYSYSVTREGYIPIVGKKIYVVSSDRKIAEVVELQQRELRVVVSSRMQPVPNASVIFTNGKGGSFGPFYTGEKGGVMCKLVPGLYTYEVTAKGMTAKKDEFNFVNQDALLIDFERRAFVLTCQQPANGALEVKADNVPIANQATIYKGCTLTITASPDAHYSLEAIRVNDRSYTESPVELEVTDDVTVSAAFAPIMHPVTYTVKAGDGTLSVRAAGTAIPSGATIAEGTEIEVTATPAVGFELDYLKANGTDLASGATYVVSKATLVEAAFRKVKGTAVEDPELMIVKASPNPFTDAVVLSNASRVQRYSVVSLQGVEVLRGTSEGVQQLAIPTAHLAPGVYVLTIYSAQAQRQMQLVKQR